MLKFRFSKLVRDKITEAQIASGAKPTYHILKKEEHIAALVDKVAEEAQEIVEATKAEAASEIADVQQAIDDLIDLVGVNREDVRKAQQEKAGKAGAFKKGIYVEHVEVNEGNQWVEYFRKNSDRYPEID